MNENTVIFMWCITKIGELFVSKDCTHDIITYLQLVSLLFKLQ